MNIIADQAKWLTNHRLSLSERAGRRKNLILTNQSHPNLHDPIKRVAPLLANCGIKCSHDQHCVSITK